MSDVLVLNMALTSRPLHTRVDRITEANDPLAGEAGRLLVMIPGMPYQLAAPSGSFRSLHCAISCAMFEEIAGEPIDWLALHSFGGEMRQGSGVETHLTRIHEELVHNRIGREIVIEACVDMISVDLVRQFREGRPARPDVHAGGLAAWRMRSISGRVHSDGPSPRIVELASLCGLTERQLSRAFKAETGMTIGRFVDEVTMERAYRLLTTTNLPIAGIARELGFASADSFARSFRRITGTPPSKVRPRS
jgi:AraC family transcriptional regulator